MALTLSFLLDRQEIGQMGQVISESRHMESWSGGLNLIRVLAAEELLSLSPSSVVFSIQRLLAAVFVNQTVQDVIQKCYLVCVTSR